MNPVRARWLLGILLLTVLVFRAATQVFTHDEVLSYLALQKYGWGFLVEAGSVNTHLLNMLGMKLALGIFGNSPLSLRLPVLLAFVAFMAALFSFAKRELRGGWQANLVIAVLASNPFFLDFFCCARGYGIGLALLLWSILRTARVLEQGPTAGRYLGLACLYMATYAASLTLAFMLLALDIVVFVFHFLNRPAGTQGFRIGLLLSTLVLPQALLAAILTWPFRSLLAVDAGAFFYGSTSWSQVVEELLPLAFAHVDRVDGFDDPLMPFLDGLAGFLPFICGGLLLSGFVLYGISARSERRSSSSLSSLVVGVTLLLAVLFHELGFRFLDQPLPRGRTGLGLLLLFLMQLGLLPVLCDSKRAALRVLRALFSLILVVVLLAQSRFLLVDHVAEWRWDAGAIRIMNQMEAMRGEDQRVEVLVLPFIRAPALDFLRERRGHDWMAPIEREYDPTRSYDFVVLSSGTALIPEVAEGLGPIVFRDVQSDTWLALPRSKSPDSGR